MADRFNDLGHAPNEFDTYHHEQATEFESFVLPADEWREPPGERRLKAGASQSSRKAAKAKNTPAASPIDKVIVGSSPAAAALREKICLYADADAPVTIVGESGVGKELAAHQLHLQSARRNKPFVPVNAGAIPETLATAELFGHVKGAFTGAIADRAGAVMAAANGSLFLDEIGEMPLSLQPHLLRVLEDGLVTKVGSSRASKVDFRLISATNVNLQKHVSAGRFRLDLYYRVNVLMIDIPPLRERGDDVVEIAEALIASHTNEKYRAKQLTPCAADLLKAHNFPGNARELRNVLERALMQARGNKILPDDIIFDTGNGEIGLGGCGEEQLNVSKAKDLVGRYLILKALKIAAGNVTKAAELTGRSRGTVHALKKQIERKDFDAEYASACNEIKSIFQNASVMG